ncbi:universal stress protein [Qingshengfaniella alkalisoli]|uniref:Universal stress protein n=1 Tax=Qingshengfaniella alkalisoli TaxID=2599296 RepID=A0A5B8J5M2_9RHOB|nr:universal stress protein [Qingshengfaniella alkalisoli]QDY69787.1 universal stress protein [Qingshengfaniella alkalisoli]
MTKLIALVDGSTYSESVCDYAAWLASRSGGSVTVAHVLGHRQGVKTDLSGNIGLGARSALLDELAELDAAKAKLAQKRGRAILDDAKARIGKDGVAQVETRLRNGDLVETLHELEADADMVVIGKRGEAADFAKLHLGSNLERVVRASRKPTLVCSRAFQPIETVMVAFDGGAASLKAVDYISRDKSFAGLKILLLAVGAESTEMRRGAEGAAALLRGGGYEVEIDIIAGEAELVIPEQIKAGRAEFVVMGAYRHSRIRNLFLGSTTTEVIRESQVPLLLFR